MKKITINDNETKSADLIADNIEALKALFPDAVTEGKVDFEVLKCLLGAATDDRDEKYGLNWHGKRRARQLALTPSTGTLLPCPEDSVDWETTKNIMIEGDNLEVLKLLQKGYTGKLKLIYIDPPYNTGKDFIYPDDFRDNIQNYLELTRQVEAGRKTSSNTETSGRLHTNWLNMMYPRLKIARNMLANDGALLCSIDDIEVQRLRSILDEIFGEENFLAQFVWRTDGNFDNQAKVKCCHEYIVLYAKSIDDFPRPPVVDPAVPPGSKLFRPEIRNTIVKNGPKNPVSSLTLPACFPADFESGDIPAGKDEGWPIYCQAVRVENGTLVEPVEVKSGWSSKDLILKFIQNQCQPVSDGKGLETSFLISKSGTIDIVKKRLEYQSHVISVLSGFGGTQKATAQLTEIGANFCGYPKPVELIQYFVRMILDKNAVMMDFYAGSGPLGHAVMAQNAADGGKRRYILVQLPELLDINDDMQKSAAQYCDKIGKPRNIAELTKERLRRATSRIKGSNPETNPDCGFRVFKLARSNIRVWEPDMTDLENSLLKNAEHIVEGRQETDILYELLLKRGLDLCVPIETRIMAGKTVHSIGGGILIACLADGVTKDVMAPLSTGIIAWIKALSPAADTCVVFKDSGFADDIVKTNMAAILNQNGVSDIRSL